MHRQPQDEIMQVFVPFPNIYDSLDLLDKKRLVKQVIECGQILDVILQRKTGKGWVNHPAVKMWYQYPDALKLYKNTGFRMAKDKFDVKWVKTKLEDMSDGNLPQMPNWWGRSDIHESHLSNLKRKAIEDIDHHRFPRSWALYDSMLDKLGQDEFSKLNQYLPYVWS